MVEATKINISTVLIIGLINLKVGAGEIGGVLISAHFHFDDEGLSLPVIEDEELEFDGGPLVVGESVVGLVHN